VLAVEVIIYVVHVKSEMLSVTVVVNMGIYTKCVEVQLGGGRIYNLQILQ